jgi:hypothetical protein
MSIQRHDSGRHTVIRGNVEYDRYTGEVYDYLNSIRVVSEPYDSLNFASTILILTGHKPPMPDRVVTLQ